MVWLIGFCLGYYTAKRRPQQHEIVAWLDGLTDADLHRIFRGTMALGRQTRRAKLTNLSPIRIEIKP